MEMSTNCHFERSEESAFQRMQEADSSGCTLGMTAGELLEGYSWPTRDSSRRSQNGRRGFQNSLPNPACFKTALAVCLDFMSLSTGNLFPEIGLNQIS